MKVWNLYLHQQKKLKFNVSGNNTTRRIPRIRNFGLFTTLFVVLFLFFFDLFFSPFCWVSVPFLTEFILAFLNFFCRPFFIGVISLHLGGKFHKLCSSLFILHTFFQSYFVVQKTNCNCRQKKTCPDKKNLSNLDKFFFCTEILYNLDKFFAHKKKLYSLHFKVYRLWILPSTAPIAVFLYFFSRKWMS